MPSPVSNGSHVPAKGIGGPALTLACPAETSLLTIEVLHF